MKKQLGQGTELDDDTGRIDRDAVHRFISEESYWAFRRPRDVMDGLIDRAARNVGLYAPDGAAGRLIRAQWTLPTPFLVYLADVFVLPEHRGHGTEASSSCSSPSRKARMQRAAGSCTPRTRTGSYEKLGFAPGERLLERAAR